MRRIVGSRSGATNSDIWGHVEQADKTVPPVPEVAPCRHDFRDRDECGQWCCVCLRPLPDDEPGGEQ